MFHSAVQHRGKHEADSYLPDTLADLFGAQAQINPQGLKNVSTAAMTGHGTVAVFCHRNSGPGHDKGRSCGDVKGAGGVTPGPHRIHKDFTRISGIDFSCLVPHDPGCSGNLVDGLTLHAQGRDE